MYLSILQLALVAIVTLIIGSILGYQIRSPKINQLKKELRIKDASLKGMWSVQEKKQKNKRLESGRLFNKKNEEDPGHVSDVYQANG